MINHSLHLQLKEKQQKLTLLQSQLREVLSEIKNIENLLNNNYIKHCKHCKVGFKPTDKRKIYCSFECNTKAQRNKRYNKLKQVVDN